MKTESARSGYTLIELIASMTAATLLLASLATTVAISTNLLETPTDDQLSWKDRDISDRISMDLRYCTSINDSVANGFQVTKTNITTGVSETASYNTQTNGLTRQIDSGANIQLDANTSTHSFITDSFNPGTVPSTSVVRVRSTSSASDSGSPNSLSIPFPVGCMNGDMVFMAISTESTNQATLSPSGWSALRIGAFNELRMFIVFTIYDSSRPGPAVITFEDGPVPGAAAAMIALENGASDPANWLSARGGVAFSGLSTTHPSPLEPTDGTEPYHLNVQFIIAEGNPWPDGTLGMKAYADAALATSGSNSVGIVLRNGRTPSLATTPRAWQQTSGRWMQTGIRVGNGG